MDNRLNTPWLALRHGIGLTATLAGIDKFFNLLADWGSYVSPLATQVLPVSAENNQHLMDRLSQSLCAALHVHSRHLVAAALTAIRVSQIANGMVESNFRKLA
jgi:hypothetical protein